MFCCAGVSWRPAMLFKLASVVARSWLVFWRSRTACSWDIAGANWLSCSLAPPFATTTLPDSVVVVFSFFRALLFVLPLVAWWLDGCPFVLGCSGPGAAGVVLWAGEFAPAAGGAWR